MFGRMRQNATAAVGVNGRDTVQSSLKQEQIVGWPDDLVHRLGRLGEDFGEVAELDLNLNPVIAGPDGCVGVDARVRLESRPAERALKSR